MKRQLRLEAFARRIEVVPIRSSRLVDISVESADSQFAAEAANTVAKTYMDRNMLDRIDASQEAVRWLHKSLMEERGRVEGAEIKLQGYKEQHSILTDFTTGNESVTAQRMAELNSQVIQAESRRMEAETRYNQMNRAKEGSLDAISEALTNTHLAAIKTAEVENQKKLAELSRKYIGGNPELAAARVESRTLQESKNNEIQKIVRSLRNEYEAALARETSLKASLARLKQDSHNLNKNAIEYHALKREAESAKQMYDLLLKRLNETVVAEDLKATNIRIIDRAVPSAISSRPEKAKILLLALLGGLVGGVALAFAREMLDNTIGSTEDIERIMELPCLSAVPAFRMNGGSLPELVSLRSPRSAASEAFRSLRTGIQFSTAGRPPEVILVTGSSPSDGKTVTAVNLAVSQAQAGSSVLLIDCDLRRPRVHKALDVPREPGLTNILAGGASPESAISRTKVPNLDVIATGVTPPNPAELVGSRRMAEFLTEMRTRYDRVILDSPPLPAFTDAAVLSSLADGVVVVVRAGVTHKAHARLTVRHLRAVRAKILGTVLNAVKPSHDNYYYRHSYYEARENT
jgi:capsular exopolysaccharide synthesis family protein